MSDNDVRHFIQSDTAASKFIGVPITDLLSEYKSSHDDGDVICNISMDEFNLLWRKLVKSTSRTRHGFLMDSVDQNSGSHVEGEEINEGVRH